MLSPLLSVRKVGGFKSRVGQIGHTLANGSPVAATATSFSDLCCPGAKPRRWAPPLITSFCVISRVAYNEGLIVHACFSICSTFFAFFSAFVGLTNVEALRLERCNSTQFPSQSLHSLRNLREFSAKAFDHVTNLPSNAFRYIFISLKIMYSTN